MFKFILRFILKSFTVVLSTLTCAGLILLGIFQVNIRLSSLQDFLNLPLGKETGLLGLALSVVFLLGAYFFLVKEIIDWTPTKKPGIQN